MELGEIIKELRTKRGLTQGSLGELVNLAESTISLYESNKRSPDYETLKKIADFFDVSLDYLLGRTNEKLPANQIKEDPAKYNLKQDSFLDDLLKRVPDLTEKEKASLADHLEFAMKLIEKERQERTQEKK